MSTRIEDNDGNGFLFITRQEADSQVESQMTERLTFESPVHAQAFFDHLALTPDALEHLFQRVREELA